MTEHMGIFDAICPLSMVSHGQTLVLVIPLTSSQGDKVEHPGIVPQDCFSKNSSPGHLDCGNGGVPRDLDNVLRKSHRSKPKNPRPLLIPSSCRFFNATRYTFLGARISRRAV